MANLFDQYLLFRIRAKRDKEAFGKLYDRYVQAIYRFVYLRVPSRELAEDVTAETFLRCWQWIQEGREVMNFRALLYRIAKNLIVDTYRKSDRANVSLSAHTTVTFHEGETSEWMHLDFELSDKSRQKSQIEAGADVRLLLDRVGQLKEDYRDVMMLRLVDGLSFGDVADILGKSSGNVRVIYHRAMKALGHLLEKKEEGTNV